MKLPTIDGVGASTVRLPRGQWLCLLDYLDARFPDVGRATWLARLREGLVRDESGAVLAEDAAFVPDTLVHYYRALPDETPIPFEATVLYRDEHLLVADKPHFLPTIPSGRYVRETLLVRLKQQTGLDDLVPLHRLDRSTAGLVLFSVNRETRGQYGALFAERRITKTYEALAPSLPSLVFPLTRCSRLVDSQPFFRVQEADGEPNAETAISMIEPRGATSLYRLEPVTGRKHQLRVHMAALGAPIVNDPWYPELHVDAGDDYARPLKLVARGLSFLDPLTGEARSFVSERTL